MFRLPADSRPPILGRMARRAAVGSLVRRRVLARVGALVAGLVASLSPGYPSLLHGGRCGRRRSARELRDRRHRRFLNPAQPISNLLRYRMAGNGLHTSMHFCVVPGTTTGSSSIIRRGLRRQSLPVASPLPPQETE